jgi:hypothetical protein
VRGLSVFGLVMTVVGVLVVGHVLYSVVSRTNTQSHTREYESESVR